MKTKLLISLIFLSLKTFASGSSDLNGKWRASKYLEWSVKDGKLVKIENIKLSPEHFGFLFYNPNQTLVIKVNSSLSPINAEEKKANDLLKVLEFSGQLQSDAPILDPACARVPFYKNNFACGYKPNSIIPLKFTVTHFDSPSFDDIRKALKQGFEKNQINDIFSNVATSHLDGSSGGSLIFFLGKNHLLIRSTYYSGPILPAGALSQECPVGNKCYSTALMFERVK
jgi:hypothetical protein